MRQGPKSFTVSARISLSEVTPFSTGISDCFRELGLRLVSKLRNCYSPFIRSSGFFRVFPFGSFEKEAEVALIP